MPKQDQSINVSKSCSDTCGIGKSKTLAILAKCRQKKTSKLPAESIHLTASNFTTEFGELPKLGKSLNTQKKRRTVHQKDFKAQIVSRKSAAKAQLNILEHRLSNNLAILVPLLKRSCPTNLLHIEKFKNNSTKTLEPLESPKGKSNFVPLTTLAPPRPVRSSQTRGNRSRFEFSSILPISSSSHLLPRNKTASEIESVSSTNITKSLPHSKEDRVINNSCSEDHIGGDTKCCRRSCESFKANYRSTQSFPEKNVCLRQTSKVKDLSPIISCGGRIGLSIPARLSTPAIVNLSVQPEKQKNSRNCKSSYNWGIFQQSGLNNSSLSKSSIIFADLTPRVLADSVPILNNTALSSLSCDSSCPDLMGSMGHSSKHQKVNGSDPNNSVMISEHHSFANLPSSFNGPVSNLGNTSLPNKKGNQLKNSKSFHGDGSSTMTSEILARSAHGGNKVQSMSNGNYRQQQHHRKMLERQRLKLLKPLSVTKNHGNISKLCEIGNDFTASIVPDSQTAAYRVSSDLSYDEGSRYNSNTSNNNSAFCAFTGHDEVSRTYQGNTSTRGKLPSSQNLNNHENQTLPTHKEQGRERTSFDPSGSYKEVVPLSLVRIEDRARRSPSANFIPANLSRGQQSQAGTSPSNNVTTFRLHKERQNWSYRMGDLSVNGGGYYGSTPIQPGGRMDVPGLGSLNISSPSSNYNQKLPPGKDKFGPSFTRSRISSRYGSRYDGSQSYLGSASKESSYSDPCVSAPPSFQQRLTELSLLESDTIKYERNRKLKRKKNSEKDS